MNQKNNDNFIKKQTTVTMERIITTSVIATPTLLVIKGWRSG